MSDPLSVTASVIACATVGLQSTKLIYDAVSGLCKSRQEFARTDQSLLSLTEILSQIQALAGQPPSTTLPVHSIGNQTQNSGFFDGLHTAVQRCVEDLGPITLKVQRWKGTGKGQSWRRKVAESIHMYIKNSDLREIHEVVSRHIGFLNIHLSIAGSKQQAEQRTFNVQSTTEVKNQIAQVSTHIQASATEYRQHFSTHLDQAKEISDRHTKDMTTGFEDLEKNNNTLQNQIGGVLETLQQSIAAEFSKSHNQSHGLHQMVSEIQRLLDSVEKNTTRNDLSERLEECIDRLYAIHSEVEGDLNIESFDAQLITADIVSILRELLEHINLPDLREVNRKRKHSESDDEEAAEIDKDIQYTLAAKRIRGILESSQSVQISTRNWQKDRIPNGRRLTSQNRVFNTPAGSLAITTMVVASNAAQKDSQLSRSSNNAMEQTFAGTLTLLPKTNRKKRNLKIRAFFVQNMMKYGSFSFTPTLSFHAVIPDDSEVFRIIDAGDLDGLVRILQDGLASSTDCNTRGQSLLGYCLNTGRFHHTQSHICNFLVSKGADVNSWEIRHDEIMMFPLLTVVASNPRGRHRDIRPANTLKFAKIWEIQEEDLRKCRRLLIEAGADPTACNLEATDGYEQTVLLQVILTSNTESLRQLLNDGRILLDLEQREERGMTALLFALMNAYYPISNHAIDFVETSFEQATLLLKHGASTSAKDYSGYTCLHHIFQRQYYYRREILIYRPHNVLTSLIVDMIHAGADLLARAKSGETPCSMAQRGNYKRSWREALEICGYSPHGVYANSGVEWEELEEVSVEGELIETLQKINQFIKIRMQVPQQWARQWTPETMQKFLIQGIQNVDDIHKRLPKHSGLSLSHIAGVYKVDKEWREALETCGYDPKMVYARSGISWLELEDIIYEETEDEDNEEDDESEEDEESDNQNREHLNITDAGMNEDIILDERVDNEARQRLNYGSFRGPWPATSQQESYLGTAVGIAGAETRESGYDLDGNWLNYTPSIFEMPAENLRASFNSNHHDNYVVGNQGFYGNVEHWLQQNDAVPTSFFGSEGHEVLDFRDEEDVYHEEDIIK